MTFAPDFYVVGAARAGTTAVYHWLRDHPDVFLPDVKEPGYFVYAGRSAKPKSGPFDPDYVSRITTDPHSYANLYRHAADRLSGDVSPVYLLDDQAATRIAAVRPDARIVIILRDPVERAFSQYLHHIRDNLEHCFSFAEALGRENDRLSNGWSWGHGYATHGHYADQIDRYFAVFPKEQILFLEHRMLRTAPGDCWTRICRHLGLECHNLRQNKQVNTTSSLHQVSGRPTLARYFRHPGSLQKTAKRLIPPVIRRGIRTALEGPARAVPVLHEDVKAQLASRYAAERQRIASATELTLDHWTDQAKVH